MIYLDNNATTALDPRVADAMRDVWLAGPANPSSQHALGRRARGRLDQASTEIGRLLGARIDAVGGDRLVLTSGGTEANNLAIRGLGTGNGPLIVSQIEHPSVLEAARQMAARGAEVRLLPVDARGVARLDVLEQWLADPGAPPRLVSLMLANNETGVLQPVEQAAALCRAAGVPLHTDASQGVGKLPVDFRRLGATALSFAAHKFHGPVGVGGLLVAPGVALRPELAGGGQQLGERPGTEAVALAVGMQTALRLWADDAARIADHLRELRDRLELPLLGGIPEAEVHGRGAPRLPSTTCISMPGVDRQAMLMRLDLAGVACSSGSACASGSSEPSHVLRAMGVPDARVEAAVRLGVSRFSTAGEIDEAVDRITGCFNKLSSR